MSVLAETNSPRPSRTNAGDVFSSAQTPDDRPPSFRDLLIFDPNKEANPTQQAWNIFNAGLKFFLGHEDPHLRRLAMSTEMAFRDKKISFLYSKEKIFQGEGVFNSGLMVFRLANTANGQEEENGSVLTALPGFFGAARENPIQLLAEIAGNLSLIDDCIDSPNLGINETVNRRAMFTSTHFLFSLARDDSPVAQNPFKIRSGYRNAR